MEKGHSTVFYSWQSDLPNSTNRGFIEEALKRAVKTIQKDDSIEVTPRVERDTIGVPGSPDISQTIFDKIDQADVFVCDVSIINITSHNKWQDRPTPNPNVLVELGYALKTLGPDRVIMVLNAAYGKQELLPFDLRPRRVLSYVMPKEVADRASERKRLEGMLTDSIQIILRKLSTSASSEFFEKTPLIEQVCLAVAEGYSTQGRLCRQYMKGLAEQITVLAPQLRVASTMPSDERLMLAIENSTPLVSEFVELTQTIARVETSQKAAMAVYKGFENIFTLYTCPPSSIRAPINEGDYDFVKFLGQELFVVFFASLIQEEQWELMAELLVEDFYVRINHFEQPKYVSFTAFSQSVNLLRQRNHRLKLHHPSLHAELLMKRYREGKLKDHLSFEHFMASDYLLYLQGESQFKHQYPWPLWIPWSTLYMQRLPDFIYKAERRNYAEQLSLILLSFEESGWDSLTTLLRESTEKWEGLWGMPGHLESFDFTSIGSR